MSREWTQRVYQELWFIGNLTEGKNEAVPGEPGKMEYIQPLMEAIQEWANGTIEGNGIWNSEGVVRRFTTAQYIYIYMYIYINYIYIQGDSVVRGPKLLSIKTSVIEIMTWKFIYTYQKQCKTGPAHNRCWNWSPFTSKHTWIRFSKFWNTFPKVSTLTAWISWHIASLSCSIVRGVFLYILPFNRPQRKKSAGVRSGDPGGQRFLKIILS